MKKEFLECGRVVTAHGVRGVLKVEPWCDSPTVLTKQKRIFTIGKDGGYEEHKILGASVSAQFVLMTVEGIDDRDKAIAMKNVNLYLHRSDIPVKKGAMLLADMIGLAVIDHASGKLLGTIRAVEEVPRGLMYTIKTEKGDVLLPSVPEFIKEIDPEVGMIVTPIPGFFD